MSSMAWKAPLVTLCMIKFGDNIHFQSNFEVEKYTGTWYSIAILLRRGNLVNANSHQQRVELLETGDLVKHTVLHEENCKVQTTRLTKSSKPGEFETNNGILYILETDYSSYAILCFKRGSQKILHLNCRSPEVSALARKRFNHFVDILELPIDRTVPLNKAVPCGSLRRE